MKSVKMPQKYISLAIKKKSILLLEIDTYCILNQQQK